MKKNVIVFGVIAGVLSASWMLWSVNNHSDSINFENGMIYGYASMILAFSLIFVAVKNYRDKYNGGVITFGKAFKIGFYISLIASTIYVVSWLIDYFYFFPEFDKVYADYVLKQMRESGASEASITEKTAEMAQFSAMYKNPFFNALLGYTEILPVGVLISLIAALILRKKTAADPTVVNS